MCDFRMIQLLHHPIYPISNACTFRYTRRPPFLPLCDSRSMLGRSQVKGSPDYTSFFTASIANGAVKMMVRDALYLNGMVNLHKYNRTAPTMIF
jgi:hypothetical protein